MEFKFKYTILIRKVNHFSQLILVKVKKNLRTFQAQFREKLRKLRFKQSNGFLIKKKFTFIEIILEKRRKCVSFKMALNTFQSKIALDKNLTHSFL